MPSKKTWSLNNILTSSNLSCGCRSKSADIVIEPKPKPNPKTSSFNSNNEYSSSFSSSSNHKLYKKPSFNVDDDDEGYYTSTTLYVKIKNNNHRRYKCPKILSSFALVKESNDPYEDFKQSMRQMILEKDMYSRDDLKQLIDCFLQLNSHHYHRVIVRAFMNIWNGDEGGHYNKL